MCSSDLALSADEKTFYKEKIRKLLKERDAVMVAHYYTDPEIQALAEETGGIVADSLEMARFGSQHPASTLLVAGVRFRSEARRVGEEGRFRWSPLHSKNKQVNILWPGDLHLIHLYIPQFPPVPSQLRQPRASLKS